MTRAMAGMAIYSSKIVLSLFMLYLLSNTNGQLVSTSVEVEQGTLIGRTDTFSEQQFINVNKQINVYEGVPFAEPPLRFVHSVKKEPWNGAWNATYPRARCIQTLEDPRQDYLPISEDCLYLNIYAPKGIRDATVMVQIHGGNDRTGHGAKFFGQPLSATGDVIVVTINYRLGAFGFITTGDETLPGNYGMMDQVQALKWIQQNIHAFGGNKDKVTILGSSSGSVSVNHHILSKQSRGLFSKAIMQSGTALAHWGFQENTEGREHAFNVGASLGCSAATSSALRQCLTQATAEEIREADAETAAFQYAPNMDGLFQDSDPHKLTVEGDFQRVPIMIGSSADEGKWNLLVLVFPTPSSTEPFLPQFIYEQIMAAEEGNSLVRDSINQQYLDWSVQDMIGQDYFLPLGDYLADWSFTCPADAVARAHAALGGTVYRYQFTHVPTTSYWAEQYGARTWTGTSHVEETPYVWGYEWFPNDMGFVFNDDEKRLSVEMMTYWAHFAKNGEPGTSSDPSARDYWPTFTIPELDYKVLNTTMSTGRALRAPYCNLINTLIPKIRAFSADLSDLETEWRSEFSNWKNNLGEWQKTFNEYQANLNANIHDEM